MTPKTKRSVVNVGAFIGAVVAVVGLTSQASSAMNNKYVTAERYRLDSINRYYRDAHISAKLAKIDSIDAKLDTLIACQRRGC